MNQTNHYQPHLTPEQVHEQLQGILLELEEYFHRPPGPRGPRHSPTPRAEDLILAGLSQAYVLGLDHGRRRLIEPLEGLADALQAELPTRVIRLEDL